MRFVLTLLGRARIKAVQRKFINDKLQTTASERCTNEQITDKITHIPFAARWWLLPRAVKEKSLTAIAFQIPDQKQSSKLETTARFWEFPILQHQLVNSDFPNTHQPPLHRFQQPLHRSALSISGNAV
jgi:hypothetical protein